MRKDWRQTVYLARSKIQGLGLYAKRDIHMGDMIIEYKVHSYFRFKFFVSIFLERCVVSLKAFAALIIYRQFVNGQISHKY